MSAPAALVFDCDGTLARNAGALFGALAAAVAEQGVALEQAWFDARPGVSTRELVAELATAHPALDGAGALRRREQLYLDTVVQVAANAPVAAVARAHHGRVPLAVASSGPRRMVAATLEAIGLLELLDAVVAIEDVARPKPAPDLYLLAAERLGVAPAHCVAYEDSIVGAQAARAAGMRVVDVTLPGGSLAPAAPVAGCR